MLILTRAPPYATTHTADDDSFPTRTYALHSFGPLLSYSNIVGGSNIQGQTVPDIVQGSGDCEEQLLCRVEDKFYRGG